jgi:hypothetical protein
MAQNTGYMLAAANPLVVGCWPAVSGLNEHGTADMPTKEFRHLCRVVLSQVRRGISGDYSSLLEAENEGSPLPWVFL